MANVHAVESAAAREEAEQVMAAAITAHGQQVQELEQRTGLASLADDNMQNISAQGINEDSQYLIDLGNSSGPDDEGGPGEEGGAY